VRVALAFDAGQVRLSVVDDGAGFVVDDGAGFVVDDGYGSSEHLGLVGMAERASALGGRLDVDSVPGRGTDVRAWLPEAPGGARASKA
jgi:signal transduction histidine kinase